jgi:hypothetical protein
MIPERLRGAWAELDMKSPGVLTNYTNAFFFQLFGVGQSFKKEGDLVPVDGWVSA